MGSIPDTPRERMEGENCLVSEFVTMSKIGSNRRGTGGVRVEHFPRIHNIADSRRGPEHDELKYNVTLSNSKDELSSCQCTTTLSWVEKRGNEEMCIANSI